jgi:hypothetical protein
MKPDPIGTAADQGHRVTPDPIRAIADAVLYEGYILWPYRRSALKNQRRFTFGGVYPPRHSEAHLDDLASVQAEVLLVGSGEVAVAIAVRFLHVVARTVSRVREGELEPVDELVLGGERHLAWDEAVEREVHAPELTLQQLRAGHRVPIAIRAGSEREQLVDDGGVPAGALVRTWKELRGELSLHATALADGVWRVQARIANLTAFSDGTREQALKQTFCSTHALLRAPAGRFVSLADPPDDLAGAVSACRNVGLWPVLVGARDDHGTMLASPIILEDHPRIAPESPGDLFDGGEIDQLLILNILTLTDEEKAEMAASDPRAREILERTEMLTPEQLMALHGTVREFGMTR